MIKINCDNAIISYLQQIAEIEGRQTIAENKNTIKKIFSAVLSDNNPQKLYAEYMLASMR